MANPIFKMFNNGGGRQDGVNQNQQGNNPQFMQMLGKLKEFRQSFQGDPQQMVMDAVKSGRISQEQLDQVQGMATQIQNMLRSMGL